MKKIALGLVLAFVVTGAQAQTRTPLPRPAAAEAVASTARPLICDPLNLLPGCHVKVAASSGAGTTTQPVELNLWQKIVNAALPDLEYASMLSAAAGTPAALVRKQCWDAIITANKQASGSGVKDAAGNAAVKPSPSLFTDVESLAEVLDNLAPNGPLWVACSGAAGLVKTNALTFINAAVTGAAGIAALGVT